MSPSPPLGPPSLKSPQTQSSLGCYKSIIYSSAVAMQNGRKMLQSCRKHTQTHIHLPMGGSRSSSPLNLHWRLTLVWTRRGCLQEAHRPEPDVSLPASPSLPHSLTPSFAFHTTVGERLLLTKTHTHIPRHTLAWVSLTWDLNLLFTPLTNLHTNSARVTWSSVGKRVFPSGFGFGDDAHSCK